MVVGKKVTAMSFTWVWVKIKPPGDRRFGPCFHFPGFHFGYIFLTHSHMAFVLTMRLSDSLRQQLPAQQTIAEEMRPAAALSE